MAYAGQSIYIAKFQHSEQRWIDRILVLVCRYWHSNRCFIPSSYSTLDSSARNSVFWGKVHSARFCLSSCLIVALKHNFITVWELWLCFDMCLLPLLTVALGPLSVCDRTNLALPSCARAGTVAHTPPRARFQSCSCEVITLYCNEWGILPKSCTFLCCVSNSIFVPSFKVRK